MNEATMMMKMFQKIDAERKEPQPPTKAEIAYQKTLSAAFDHIEKQRETWQKNHVEELTQKWEVSKMSGHEALKWQNMVRGVARHMTQEKGRRVLEGVEKTYERMQETQNTRMNRQTNRDFGLGD